MTVHSASTPLAQLAENFPASMLTPSVSAGIMGPANPINTRSRARWKIARAVCGGFLLAGGMSLTLPAFAIDKDELALSMVQKYDFGRNLQIIGFAFAQQAQNYPRIVQALGPGSGDALIQRHLAVLAAKYQSQWDAYLAAAYSAVFSEDALQSFADQGPKNSHMAEFEAKRAQVGQLMREKSATLLTRYVDEALNMASEEMSSLPTQTLTAQVD